MLVEQICVVDIQVISIVNVTKLYVLFAFK